MKRTHEQHASTLPWLGYIAPMVAFMVLTTLEGSTPNAAYVWLYLFKIFIVTALLLSFRSPWKDIRPKVSVLIPAVLVGLAIFGEWILIDKSIPYPHLGDRTELNPFLAIESSILLTVFLTVRFYGLVVVVPVMEELFWRSFLLRYLTNPDFTTLPMGTFSWGAFAIGAGMFGLFHSEWLVAVICACAYALLLRQTRSLFACMVAHGVTNFALGIYVVLAQDWVYW